MPSDRTLPDFQLENKFWARDRLVAGVDEAGRGCVAGPIVAAAVVAAPNSCRFGFWGQVNDSKRIAPELRQRLAAAIAEGVLSFAVGWVLAAEVDELGINQANRLAMERAVQGLTVNIHCLLADWISIWPLHLVNMQQIRVAKGDARHLSIAAASILAKVHRDRYMTEAQGRFPAYGFGKHKGYLTKGHAKALNQYGPCPEHRFSFRPLLGAFERTEHAVD